MADVLRAREPFFGDIPAVVPSLAAVIAAVSALVFLGPPGLSNAILATCMVLVGWPPGAIVQPLGPAAPYVLHVLVHGSWMHLTLNLLGLLAFGAPVARRLRSPLAFLAFFALCSIAGAGVEALRPTSHPVSMLGASSGVFGLVAGATYVRLARWGPLPDLSSRPMIEGLLPWVVVNLLLALVGGAAFGAPIAWAAHLGGLAAGALAFPLFDRLAHPSRA